MKKIIYTLTLVCLINTCAQGQILISLLFGDKLNSEKLEFGLDAGLAATNFSTYDLSNARTDLHLGLYFNIKMADHWFIHTGLIMKSPGGMRYLDPYYIDEPSLDSILQTATLTRKLSYFHLPALVRYSFNNHFFIEAGPQLGLLNKATDRFVANVEDEDDLVYERNIKDQVSTFDFGFTGGMGYQLLQGEGISLGVRYYLGLNNVMKDDSLPKKYNRIFYLFASIPIGATKEE